MKFPFQWSLFGGHIHFWRVNDGLLVLRVLLRQSWAWHNQTRGRSASDKQQVAPKRTQIPRNKKKQACQTTSRSDEKTQKKNNTKKRKVSSKIVFLKICVLFYIPILFICIYSSVPSQKGVEKPRTQKDVGSNPLVGIEAFLHPSKMPTFRRKFASVTWMSTIWCLGWMPCGTWCMEVSLNGGFSPQIIHLLIGFSIIFTIHFGVPLFWKHPHDNVK